MSDDLKAQGNEFFSKGEYEKAEELFSKAINEYSPTAILFTNRAAARFHLNKFDECIEDACSAIELDKKWLKAYYRKAVALEALGKHRDAYRAWEEAYEYCEHNSFLKKNMTEAEKKWVNIFRTFQVDSVEDMLQRYQILSDSREKLSTLAHFWNSANGEERFSILTRLMEMIGGKGDLPTLFSTVNASMMPELPMDNYTDLPNSQIPAWMDFFRNLDSSGKTKLMEGMWDMLTSAEKTVVVGDLRVFTIHAVEAHRHMEQARINEIKNDKAAKASPENELD